MKKPKEQFEWVDITSEEAQGLADNAPELLHLLKNIPDTSPVHQFLFPTLKMKEKQTTTKNRFLAVCKALTGKKTSLNPYARINKIHKAFRAPANPKQFHRFIATLNTHARSSTMLPLALDLKSKVNSLRATQFLGHPSLDVESWLSLGKLGNMLDHSLSIQDQDFSYDGISTRSLNSALMRCTIPRSKKYLRLKQQAYDSTKRLKDQDAEFLDNVDQAITSFPSALDLDPYTSLQMAHLLDTPIGAAAYGSDSTSHSNLYLFTDGAHLLIKVGVFCSPRLASALPPQLFTSKHRNYFRDIPKKGTEKDKIYYALVDLVTATPYVYDFDNFIPVGERLPRVGDKYFTVATFDVKPQEASSQSVSATDFCATICGATDMRRVAPGYARWVTESLPSRFGLDFAVTPSELHCHQIPNSPSLSQIYCAQAQDNTNVIIEPETFGWHIEQHISSTSRSRISYGHHASAEDINQQNELVRTPWIAAHFPNFYYNDDICCDPSTPGVVFKPAAEDSSTPSPYLTPSANKHTPASAPRLPFDPTENRDPLCLSPQPLKELFTPDISSGSAYEEYYGKDQAKILRKKAFGPLILADSHSMVRLHLPLSVLTRAAFASSAPVNLDSFAFLATFPATMNPSSSLAMPSHISSVCNVRSVTRGMADAGYSARRAPAILPRMPEPSLPNLISRAIESSPTQIHTDTPITTCISTIGKDLQTLSFTCGVTYYLSPLTISEGTIHIAPGINSLNTLAKWGKVLRRLRRECQSRDQSIVDAAKEDINFFTPRTMASRFRELTRATETNEPL